MNTAEQNYRLLQEIDANRSFMLMAYQQNPKLLEHAEVRIKQMFEEGSLCQIEERTGISAILNPQSSIPAQQRGASLIELIMFIIIISVALAGILLVMNVTTKSSADPLVRKQAIAAAYSLLEEIELQDFGPAPGVVCTALAPGCNPLTLQMMRAAVYHTVSDYNGFATNGIFPVTGAAALTGLETYNVGVAVTPAAVASVPAAYSIAAGSAVQINVTVTAPNNEAITATGYRAAY